ncbi:hypothetical protein [Rothia sp. ZJ932]|uniref:hypothetical protein n=1 Tax=Rothia sp. ZJ932 TaxID=2810516 RepID=UPI001968A41F|nr:hypothetical protein [Rothia sp. ZJ932]QRZ62428.1 hypothetical protein JR346_04910 [Rothia sp. ZJ932]
MVVPGRGVGGLEGVFVGGDEDEVVDVDFVGAGGVRSILPDSTSLMVSGWAVDVGDGAGVFEVFKFAVGGGNWTTSLMCHIGGRGASLGLELF